MGVSIAGEKIGFVPGNLEGSWLGKGEFRRLTMRGLTRPRLLTARKSEASCSNASNHCFRSLGLSGGKGPGAGLETPAASATDLCEPSATAARCLWTGWGTEGFLGQ